MFNVNKVTSCYCLTLRALNALFFVGFFANFGCILATYDGCAYCTINTPW